MLNKNYYSTEIKNRVTMPDVVARYGFKVGHNRRIPCPFHNGEDDNLGYKADFFKCFVCGVSGDVITFVQKYHGLSFSDTLVRMDKDFHLGLGVGEYLCERERLYRAQKAFEEKQERKLKKMSRDRVEKAYHDTYDEFARLDRQMIDYRPKSEEEELHPKFLEALQKIETARYMLACAEEEVYLYEQQQTNRNT